MNTTRSNVSSRKPYYYATVVILVITATTCSRHIQNGLAVRIPLAEAKKVPSSTARSRASAVTPRSSSGGSSGRRPSGSTAGKQRKKGTTTPRRSTLYNDDEEEEQIEEENYYNSKEEAGEEFLDEEQEYQEELDEDEEVDYQNEREEEEEEEEEEDYGPAQQRSSSHRLTSGGNSSSRRHRERARKMEEEDIDDVDEEQYYYKPSTRRTSSVGTAGAKVPRRKGGVPTESTRKTTPQRKGTTSKYRGGPPPPRSRARPTTAAGGAMVPYAVTNAAGAFTRGLVALKEYIPDPSSVKDSALKAVSAATETTSSLSKGFYREIKGLTSSELEQVMLKATRPDDSPVKSKHVERLVGVTYQISARYDIYDAVLRKLWKKMVEVDWRTKIKALYILHRFSADGSADHGPALKARLRELRRTRDPKKKEKYFNSKQLLSGDMSLVNAQYRTFVPRYAHYVLLRAQCFSGMFTEIAPEERVPPTKRPTPKAQAKQPPSSVNDAAAAKPITSTCLRTENLEAAKLVLKAGCACVPKDGETCENIALASERVVVDLMSLTAAVALALNRAIKGKESKDADPEAIKLWCQFYSDELLPQTKATVKKASPILDAFGLYLPTRISTAVSKEVLRLGLQGGVVAVAKEEEVQPKEAADEVEVDESKDELKSNTGDSEKDSTKGKDVEEQPKVEAQKEQIEEDEEYEYEDEYYDE